MPSADVVVIGAGFAGLAAASALAAAGRQVVVLDARPQLGGRATAFVDRATGEIVDNGQHVLFGCYHETFAFLDRVGATTNVRVQPSMRVPFLDRDGVSRPLECPPLPSPLHLLAGVLDWDPIPWRERFGALRLAGALSEARRAVAHGEAMPVASERTVAEWLRDMRQGPVLTEWLWDPLAIAALNQSPGEAAAAPFLRVLAGLFGSNARDAALALPVVPLNQAYAEPARAFIRARGGVVRERTLARLAVDDHGIIAVEAGGVRIDAAHAVIAVPWFALKNLFGHRVPPQFETIVARASAMASKPIVTVNLWYDEAVMDEAFVGLPGRPVHWIFDRRALVGAAASHLSLVVSGADDLVDWEDEAIVELAVREVSAALPRASGRAVKRSTVIRERRATFSLAPGQPPRPGTRTPVPGLFLAGDWIDTGLPGTIESAVVSGHRAAAEILAS